jgi:hypothetical protein
MKFATLAKHVAALAFFAAVAACEPPPCIPGEVGCPDEDTADAGVPPPTTECDDARPCPAGEDCTPAGACETLCPTGTLSCPCNDDDSCTDSGLVCGDGGTCQQPSCEAGTIGCGCLPDLTCIVGDGAGPVKCDPDFRVCREVVDESDQPGVPTTACFTPCRESVTLADGTFRECRADRLMEGCIGALECVQGSCVGNGENPPTCSRPTDCPEHQVCLDGGCYSNCDTEADCASNSVCDRHVCRQPCQATANECARGFNCDTIDGVDGVCRPVGPPSGILSNTTQTGFTVSVDDDTGREQPPSTSGFESMTFNANFQSRTFRIKNTGSRQLTLTVRKFQETRLTGGGRDTTTYVPPSPEVIPTNPLFWLKMGTVEDEDNGTDDREQRQEINDIVIQPNQTKVFIVSDPVNGDLSRWEGKLEIVSSDTPPLKKQVSLEYSSDPVGQWSGSVHYFTSFDDDFIDAWRASKNGGTARATKNALLVQWTNFRTNSAFSLQKFRTLLRSTRLESWSEVQTQAACDELFEGVQTTQHCYLYADGTPDEKGVAVYTDDADEVRIPTGSVEMPFVMNLEASSTSDGKTFSGRLESSRALQYPGNPAVSLQFGALPDGCENPTAAACIVPIKTFATTVVMGGRHLLTPGGTCAAASLKKTRTPWLLSDFLEGTVLDEEDGRTYREECKETTFPVASSASPFAAALNASFTDSNPIPDGRVRNRNITLLDGIMINQDTIIMLVQEKFDANLVGTTQADFSAYGVIELRKNEVEPTPAQFTAGLQPITPTQPTANLLATTCSADLIDKVLDGEELTAANAGQMASTLITGFGSAESLPMLEADVDKTIHYLCHSTGRFDGGPDSYGISGKEPCPATSQVTFFAMPPAVLAASVRNDPCQGAIADRCPSGDCAGETGKRGTCADTLLAFVENPVATRATANPPTACASKDDPRVRDLERVTCSDNRADLTVGRLFYPVESGPKFTMLRAAVDDAFRFKSRFRARSGQGIGFVPEICALDSDVIPYCYDPPAIEALRERVDCLVAIFNDFPAVTNASAGAMSVATRTLLKETLGEVFSIYGEGPSGETLPVGTPSFDGFERLYAELLIMKGDDSLTKAASSRFDLAGANNALFEGDLLEPDGIQIAGGAGFEMNLLYQSGQYYQLVLDRFARLSPSLWKGLGNPSNNIISLKTIETYFSRVIQASTKKARIASELATRYRAFNSPDLARRVIERAYAQAYLESTTISQLMRNSNAVLDANQLKALNKALERAHIQTSSALDTMLEDYREITDNRTFFGDAPEFVSFPQAGNFDTSAVQTMIDRAKGTIGLAKEREERALSLSRTFDTDAAQFQSELSRVANGFENDLGDLCGLFEGDDGNVYPAIPKYQMQSAATAVFGNSCGLMGNGAIYDTAGDLDQAALDLRIAVQAVKDTQSEANIESQRAKDECGVNFELAKMKFTAAGDVTTVQTLIAEQNKTIAGWERKLGVLDRQSKVASGVAGVAQSAAGAASCSVGLTLVLCVAGNVAAGAANGAVLVLDSMALDAQNKSNTATADAQQTIQDSEKKIAGLQATTEFQQQAAQCCLEPVPTPSSPPIEVGGCQRPGPLMINSEARVKTILLGMMRAKLTADRADLEVELTLGRLAQLRAKSNRMIAQQTDSEQLLINVEAARNDPNVRIFKNADVLDADKSFKNSLVDAFRATRVFEYYTGQSYADKKYLFEARLVGRGEHSVENYVNDLERDLRTFEERFGRPSPRVMIVSMKDDIFRIPYVNAAGVAYVGNEREKTFRARLGDVALLDARGYIAVPFSTELDRTSPLTAIHKLTGVEVDLQGTTFGDNVGRIYLTARGTGTVRTLDQELVFHRFPAITAVVNPTFGGNRANDPSLYRNTRLQDRPLINTTWELGLNQRDEFENQDIRLDGLTDIKMYFYYEDFTFVD